MTEYKYTTTKARAATNCARFTAGRGHVIRCRKAANVSGWITAATEAGSIIRAWAGEFTVAGEVRA